MKQFLTILKKARSFSRCPVKCSHSRQKIRTYVKNIGKKIRTYHKKPNPILRTYILFPTATRKNPDPTIPQGNKKKFPICPEAGII